MSFEQIINYWCTHQLGVMAASHCHSRWRWWFGTFVTDPCNVMMSLFPVVFLSVWLELTQLLMDVFFVEFLSAVSSIFTPSQSIFQHVYCSLWSCYFDKTCTVFMLQVCSNKGVLCGFCADILQHIRCASVLAHSFTLLGCAVCADNETPNQTHD